MEFKDYYATLGVERTATHDEIKRAYRKLARKYHPDVSKEPDAEARFKELAEAHEALIEPERRAAYDDIVQRRASGRSFDADAAGAGYEFSGRGAQGRAGNNGADFSEFFESVFGRGARGGGRGGGHGGGGGGGGGGFDGADHHAKVFIDLQDAYFGAQRTVTLRVPVVGASGHATMQDRQLDVRIPKGVRQGQHLRLSGQGEAGHGGGPAGDLYLELQFEPHHLFRVDGSDIYFDLPATPWEAALGAVVAAPTPEGSVQLRIPAGSAHGRKLRLKGKGLPGGAGDKQPGDLYAVLAITLPPAVTQPAKDAYTAFAGAFADYDPRAALEA